MILKALSQKPTEDANQGNKTNTSENYCYEKINVTLGARGNRALGTTQ